MSGLPAWVCPRQPVPHPADPAQFVAIRFDGPIDSAISQRAATSLYLWAKTADGPLPQMDRIRRYGDLVVMTYPEPLSSEHAAQLAAEFAAGFDSGFSSVMLGRNTTGATVAEVLFA